MSEEQQRDILDKTYNMLTEFCGKPPRGVVAPWWEASAEMVEQLLAYGIEYDHSMSHEDCQMYWLRTGDSWTKIDYSQKAETWMKPLVRGQMTGLVEIPGSWYIDDLPPMMFIKNSANSHGWVNPRDVEDIWKVSLVAVLCKFFFLQFFFGVGFKFGVVGGVSCLDWMVLIGISAIIFEAFWCFVG
jgi:peptidoglycan/xylan/chitin deacetylase (PgdA/CDA1 family)